MKNCPRCKKKVITVHSNDDVFCPNNKKPCLMLSSINRGINTGKKQGKKPTKKLGRKI